MLVRVKTQRLQRLEVKLLRVAGIGLEDDLELVVHLHAVRVLAVTPIIRADGGLDVSHVPRLGTQDAQGGSGVQRARAQLRIIRLPDQATVICPEVLEGEDDGLEVKGLGHRN